MPSFDSILVRLKVQVDDYRAEFDKFRFHTGSIKSEHHHKAKSRKVPLFRFHTGSIKREYQGMTGNLNDNVSIPYWFD